MSRPVSERARTSARAEMPSVAQAATVEELARLLRDRPRWFVLTGAGCSTETGIPDYRDEDGQWKRSPPIQYREFVDKAHARKRYWARSMVGWVHFSQAEPGSTHQHLAELERRGWVNELVTQNVDGLHQRAGSERVTDLHGNLHDVACMSCGAGISRGEMQMRLEQANPDFQYRSAELAPDGDVDLGGVDYESFDVPDCPICGGILKPVVVFFGEAVPRARVEHCYQRLSESDALLVVGSSLMVFSGYRFARKAAEDGKPIAIVNLGRTRADDLVTAKVGAPCADTLAALLEALPGR